MAGDVTVGTWKMKIICVDRVSVGLSYDANFKRHMPICVERYRDEQKYMPFFGTVTERAFRKKNPKHKNIYKSSQCCALDFFPQNTLGDGPTFWIFSRIQG